MSAEQTDRLLDRFKITSEFSALLVLTNQLPFLEEIIDRLNSISAGEVNRKADVFNALSGYEGLISWELIERTLRTSVKSIEDLKAGLSLILTQIDGNISSLEPQVVAQFEPNQDEKGAIEAYLSQPTSFALSEIIPQVTSPEEAQFALRQYLGSIIGYTILRRETYDSGPENAIEALRASNRLTTLLHISPDNITQMQDPANPISELKQLLTQQASSFFAFLRSYNPADL